MYQKAKWFIVNPYPCTNVWVWVLLSIPYIAEINDHGRRKKGGEFRVYAYCKSLSRFCLSLLTSLRRSDSSFARSSANSFITALSASEATLCHMLFQAGAGCNANYPPVSVIPSLINFFSRKEYVSRYHG